MKNPTQNETSFLEGAISETHLPGAPSLNTEEAQRCTTRLLQSCSAPGRCLAQR